MIESPRPLPSSDLAAARIRGDLGARMPSIAQPLVDVRLRRPRTRSYASSEGAPDFA